MKNDEVMNKKPEEEPGKRHFYILEMYIEDYWHKDYNVLNQEHNQLQENSIQHIRSEMDKELDELWKLILQHSSRTNTGQKKKGRLAGRNGTGEGNGKLQIRVSKTASEYVKRTAADSEALQHKGGKLERQTTTTVIKDKLSNQVWDPGGHRPEVHD